MKPTFSNLMIAIAALLHNYETSARADGSKYHDPSLLEVFARYDGNVTLRLPASGDGSFFVQEFNLHDDTATSVLWETDPKTGYVNETEERLSGTIREVWDGFQTFVKLA